MKLSANEQKLIAILKQMTGHNAAISHDGDDDDVGHCSHCRGWNMEHKATCPVLQAEQLIAKLEKVT